MTIEPAIDATPYDYAALLPELGMSEGELPAIRAASRRSWATIQRARAQLAPLRAQRHLVGLAIFAVGSVGRFESSERSDLDLAVLRVRAPPSADAAEEARARVVSRLRALTLDVTEKTFRRVIDLRALLRDIGGSADNNDHLTYRALLLTEGAWLAEADASALSLTRMFDAYTRGRIAPGRYFTALSNDLHRYYRTLCVDYRFKVEEANKRWAVRLLKLRHSRKLWHLANIATYCAAAQVDDASRESLLRRELGEPPLWRLVKSMRRLDGLPLCPPILRSYDRFLAALADANARAELDRLAHDDRHQSPVFCALYSNADEFTQATHAIIEHLWDRCHDHLLRYGIL